MDGDAIPLISVARLRVGERGVLWLDIIGAGITPTLRDTSEVISIIRLQEPHKA